MEDVFISTDNIIALKTGLGLKFLFENITKFEPQKKIKSCKNFPNIYNAILNDAYYIVVSKPSSTNLTTATTDGIRKNQMSCVSQFGVDEHRFFTMVGAVETIVSTMFTVDTLYKIYPSCGKILYLTDWIYKNPSPNRFNMCDKILNGVKLLLNHGFVIIDFNPQTIFVSENTQLPFILDWDVVLKIEEWPNHSFREPLFYNYFTSLSHKIIKPIKNKKTGRPLKKPPKLTKPSLERETLFEEWRNQTRIQEMVKYKNLKFWKISLVGIGSCLMTTAVSLWLAKIPQNETSQTISCSRGLNCALPWVNLREGVTTSEKIVHDTIHNNLCSRIYPNILKISTENFKNELVDIIDSLLCLSLELSTRV